MQYSKHVADSGDSVLCTRYPATTGVISSGELMWLVCVQIPASIGLEWLHYLVECTHP